MNIQQRIQGALAEGAEILAYREMQRRVAAEVKKLNAVALTLEGIRKSMDTREPDYVQVEEATTLVTDAVAALCEIPGMTRIVGLDDDN